MVNNPRDLQSLLDLDGVVIELLEGRYFVRFEAHAVPAIDEVPHGIKYSLTLHSRAGTRLVGFDNAHRVVVRRGRFADRPAASDHWHIGARDRGEPYRFESAGK